MLSTLIAAFLVAGPSNRVSEAELTAHLRILASPAMEGRLTATPGGDLAANYIEREFEQAGLKPGPSGSFIHTFPITVNLRPTTKNLFTITRKDGQKTALGTVKDYLPLAGSANMKMVDAPVAFVGFGLEDEDWNDYAGIDVTGKVVLVFRGAPEGKKAVSNSNKARTAAAKGAVGIVFVGPALPSGPEFSRTNRNFGIPTSLELVGAGIDSRYFKTITDQDFATARKATKPASKLTETTVRIVTELEPNAGLGKNVIGYLPGNDPELKNEYIIVGGHYDHLGFGEVGSRTGTDMYHAGADDNGSGTAAVMALAKMFAKEKSNKRTIIFQCYAGEEEGLVGSTAWAKDNPEILAKTTAALNMDMIGTVRQQNVYVFGTSSSKGWEGLLNGVKVDGLNLVLKEHVRGDSDQASFARRNVPVLFFHTGLTDTYHTEKDLFSTINVKGMADVATAVAQTTRLLDSNPKLTFNPDVVLGNKPDDRKVPPSDPVPTPGDGDRQIRVGFMPDYEATGPGALITGTSPDSPAEKAGFKPGDRIMKFNGREVNDIQGLSDAMKTCKPGDKVKVTFVREGKELTVELVVEARTDG